MKLPGWFFKIPQIPLPVWKQQLCWCQLFFLQWECTTVYSQYWNKKQQCCPKVSFLWSKFQDHWQTGMWLWVVFSFLKCDSHCSKAAKFWFIFFLVQIPWSVSNISLNCFIFLTSSMSVLQVKFHSTVCTFPQKPFLFSQNKYFKNLHSAGETGNFETKFIISIIHKCFHFTFQISKVITVFKCSWIHISL